MSLASGAAENGSRPLGKVSYMSRPLGRLLGVMTGVLASVITASRPSSRVLCARYPCTCNPVGALASGAMMKGARPFERLLVVERPSTPTLSPKDESHLPLEVMTGALASGEASALPRCLVGAVSCRGAGGYRGTSLIRNRRPLGPYSRQVPRALWQASALPRCHAGAVSCRTGAQALQGYQGR